MTDRFVAILMGSDSDLPQMQGAIDVLKKFSIRTEVKVTSAHRTPKQLIIMLLMPRAEAVPFILREQAWLLIWLGQWLQIRQDL